MRKKGIAALLCAALLCTALAGCGRAKTPDKGLPDTPGTDAQGAPPAQNAPLGVEASFPLLSRPFSDAESEAMVNHNARRCALTVVNYYYCRGLYSDGSCALLRYEIVDNVLRRRTLLLADCPADFLSEREGRLYYLNASGRPESVGTDGSALRVELDEPCLSLQLAGGALYCLRADGTLLSLRGGETESVLSGCGWAFVSEQGIFYTAAADGRAHLYDPAARTDVTLTAGRAQEPTLIGTTLYYCAEEADGLYLCALELADGTSSRRESALGGRADFLRGWDGAWQLRLAAGDGQKTIPLSAAFDASAAGEYSGEPLRRCRGVDDVLHTDELFSADGTALGFELVLPGGLAYASLAADNPPEK